MMDVSSKSVSFESTSGHLGRSLQLMRIDNRIGPKQLIVVTQDKNSDLSNVWARTARFINFIKDDGLLF